MFAVNLLIPVKHMHFQQQPVILIECRAYPKVGDAFYEHPTHLDMYRIYAVCRHKNTTGPDIGRWEAQLPAAFFARPHDAGDAIGPAQNECNIFDLAVCQQAADACRRAALPTYGDLWADTIAEILFSRFL